jgi:hypothetical protein
LRGIEKWYQKTFFLVGWRDSANMVAPLENMWSKQSFYVNRISRPWSRPEMLAGSWDILYEGDRQRPDQYEHEQQYWEEYDNDH